MNCRNGFFRLPEDKIEVFVLFESTFARFWGFSRTKTSFLSSGGLPDKHFLAS